DNLGGCCCPTGNPQGDPICNTFLYAVDWAGPSAGDILLLLTDMPPGEYWLYSYHNHWEPCSQSTRNCLQCECDMPAMPTITANPLPSSPPPEYNGYSLPLGSGTGVTQIENDYDVWPTHYYLDSQLVPSLIKFETDGSEVLVIYEADNTLWPDCARPGREGTRAILNAFELVWMGPGGPDTSPPTPNPATFASAPAAVSDTEITMTATTGSDPSGPVEYYFDETSGNPGGSDSGWVTNPVYNDTGLTASTQYTYTVQMRDSVPNTGTASAPANATTNPVPDTDPPTPNPATFASPPAAVSSSEITMTATTGSDASPPVEYFFDEISGNPGGTDSGWITNPVYNDTGLQAETQYTYTVQMRDNLANTGTASAPANATTDPSPDTDPPTPNPATFASPPAAVSSSEITMTATTGSDASPPVEYFFDETSGNPGGSDSGWVTNPVYNDTGLDPDTQYTYTVQMRDSVPNTGTASAPANATTNPAIDTDPPTPDPATFASPPAAVSSTEITMTATTGSDASPPVEYYFDETSGNPGGTDSGWGTDPVYNDSGLTASTQYTYTVQMRDSVTPTANVGTASTPANATTDPAAGGPVEILGSWTSGTTHAEESGSSRALVFIAHAESSADTSDLGSVTYGGQSMTKVVERNEHVSYSAYTCAFILDEAGIAAASDGTLSPTWNTAPSGTPAYTSVFLGNVNQTTLVGATGTGGTTTTTAETAALSNSNGDMAIVAGTCGNDAEYSTINSFTEAIEVAPSSADGIGGYLACTGSDVTPGVSHTNVNRQSVIGFVVQAGGPPDTDPPTPDPATFASAPAAVSDTEITMTATTGSDASGPVEYFFDETSGNPGGTDSGWVTNPVYNDTGLDPSTQYTYTVQMRDSLANTGTASAPANATTNADTNPPTPNPATFSSAPAAVSDTEITMTATTGTDISGPVEYFFDETSGNPGGTDSGWVTNPVYNDTGLTASTQYTYTVQMRDSLANTGTASAPANATTDPAPDTDPPTPNPATFASAPAAVGTTEITMTATTGSDASPPVEYFFDETSGNPGGTDSGWVTNPVYNDTGLDPNTQYTYTVQMRDSLANTGTASAPANATTDPAPETDPPTPDPATFASAPAAVSDTEITMTATTGSDASGPVEYYFDETSGNPGGTDSGWVTNPVYNDTGLQGSTQYTYTVQMRDSLANTGTASAPANATTDPTPDTDPPTPDPATFASAPAAVSDTEITMTATTGSDASGPVEYYFDETSGNPGGTDSGWVTNPVYNDTGLTASTQYTYTVQMRDSVPNTGTASAPANATTDPPPDTDPPTPDPATFASAPAAVSDTEITMTATTGSDASPPVEYYFDENSGNPGGSDSGWITNTTYNDTGLDPETQYTYTVQMRDSLANTGTASAPASATTDPKSDCGAAPMYRDSAIANVSAAGSCTNALLPLIPSMLCLGFWSIRRRKRS
ncbi:MAG: hypothetical protein ACYTEL_07065, partial [Planctomycetota bacterium]